MILEAASRSKVTLIVDKSFSAVGNWGLVPEGPYENCMNHPSESAHRHLTLLQDLANNSHLSLVEGHSLGVNVPEFQPSLCMDAV